MDGQTWLLDFVKGEAREMTREEAGAKAMEFWRRCTIKNGIVYVDCKPPEDVR